MAKIHFSRPMVGVLLNQKAEEKMEILKVVQGFSSDDLLLVKVFVDLMVAAREAEVYDIGQLEGVDPWKG